MIHPNVAVGCYILGVVLGALFWILVGINLL